MFPHGYTRDTKSGGDEPYSFQGSNADLKTKNVGQKMNVMSGKFKDEKKLSNHQNLFSFIVGSCERFESFGVHISMSVECAIEKLQIIAKEKEAQKNEHIWRQAKEAKLLRKKRRKRRVVKNKTWSVKYSTVDYKVVATFIIIFKMTKKKCI